MGCSLTFNTLDRPVTTSYALPLRFEALLKKMLRVHPHSIFRRREPELTYPKFTTLHIGVHNQPFYQLILKILWSDISPHLFCNMQQMEHKTGFDHNQLVRTYKWKLIKNPCSFINLNIPYSHLAISAAIFSPKL